MRWPDSAGSRKKPCCRHFSTPVSGNPRKARELAEKYGVDHTCSYDEYRSLLDSGDIDAVYIATPNSLHKAMRQRRRGCTCCARSPWRLTAVNARK